MLFKLPNFGDRQHQVAIVVARVPSHVEMGVENHRQLSLIQGAAYDSERGLGHRLDGTPRLARIASDTVPGIGQRRSENYPRSDAGDLGTKARRQIVLANADLRHVWQRRHCKQALIC